MDELPNARGLYLLHFAPRYLHAGHYLGYSDSIGRRVSEHLSCGQRSSPLVRAAIGAGSEVTVARLWPGETRRTERRLKRGGGLSRHCPLCRQSGSFHK